MLELVGVVLQQLLIQHLVLVLGLPNHSKIVALRFQELL